MTRDQDDRQQSRRSPAPSDTERLRRIGQNVFRLRDRHGWDQPTLAGKAKISVDTLSRIERGVKVSGARHLDVARALGVTLQALEAGDVTLLANSGWQEFQQRHSAAMLAWEHENVFGSSRGTGLELPAMPLAKIYVEPAVEVDEIELPVLAALEAQLHQHPVVVICADFGMGKSLTARMLASRLAQRQAGRGASGAPWYPLFATCLDVLLGNPECSAAELQQRVILTMERRLGRDVSIDDAAAMVPGPDRPTLTILDGFDEVPFGEETAARLLRTLRDAGGPTRRFVVFTRPGVLPKGVAALGIVTRSLLPFDEERARRWFIAWNSLPGQRVTVDPSAVLADDALAEIRTIPILCFMIATMWGTISAGTTRSSLYERFGRLLARGKIALLGEHHRIVEAASRVLAARPRPPVPTAVAASDHETGQIDALLWLMGRIAWESHVLEARDDGIHGRDASTTPFTSAPDLMSVHYLEGLLGNLLGPDIGDVTSLCTALLLSVQGSLRQTDRYLFFGHRSFREFFVARYWLAELLALLDLSGEARLARERDLCRGPLLRRGDASFDFLAEQLERLPHEPRERLATWGRTVFNDESLSPDAHRILDDRRHWLRNAALGVAGVCAADGVLVDGRTTLRSMLAHMWLVESWEYVHAPRLRHRAALLSSVNLSSARLERADLREANFITADLSGADLRGADLRDADLTSADLSGADLQGADLRGADLVSAQLMDADLRQAKLQNANLRLANLMDADLREARLEGAILAEASLLDADLRDVDLTGVDLSEVAFLDEATLEGDDDS